MEKGTTTLCSKSFKSAMPCHECTVPGSDLGNYHRCTNNPYPTRQASATRAEVADCIAIIARGTHGTVGPARQRLAQLSVFPLINSDSNRPGFNLHAGNPGDLVHNDKLGVSLRTVEATIAKLRSLKATAAIACFDERLQELSNLAHPGIVSMREGAVVGAKEKMDGSKWETAVTVLPFLLWSLPDINQNLITPLIKHAIALAKLRPLWYADEFTEADLKVIDRRGADWGKEHISLFGSLNTDSESKDAGGATIKAHELLGGHLTTSTRLFGRPMNFSASTMELLHTRIVHQHADHTNNRGHDLEQIVRREQLSQTATTALQHITHVGDEDEEAEDEPGKPIPHVMGGDAGILVAASTLSSTHTSLPQLVARACSYEGTFISIFAVVHCALASVL